MFMLPPTTILKLIIMTTSGRVARSVINYETLNSMWIETICFGIPDGPTTSSSLKTKFPLVPASVLSSATGEVGYALATGPTA
jgi:hypothetical protein